MSEQRHTPDSLAERLDELLPPGQPEQVNQDGDPLIQAAAWLTSAPQPQMSPEAMARIQAQVIHAQQIQRSSSRPRFPSAARWALVASFVLVVLFAGSIPSSLASVPGDLLYPVKQAVEQVELTFANSPESSAATHLVHAERRSQEAAALLTRGQFNPALLNGAIEELAVAAQIVQSGDNFDSALKDDLQRRTVIVNAQVNTVLALVGDATQVPDSTVVPFLTEIHATQEGGGLLLPTDTPTVMPSPTEAPLTMIPTITLTPIPSLTEMPTVLIPTMTVTSLPPATVIASPVSTEIATEALILTPTPTSLPANLIIEGSIEAINGNIIVIYGFEIELSPDDPLLLVLRVGDVVRVEGNFDGGVVIAILVTIVNVDVVINEAGEIWRDSGDCTNPPPPWATANGWRARCQNQQQPGNGGGNNGNNGNNGNSGNSGMGMGMGSGSGS